MITRIKICGITNLEDAVNAVDLGADALGFVFAESPRRVSLDRANEIISQVPPFVLRVGVFVNENESLVKEIIDLCNLDAAQFHGDESRDYCLRFKKTCRVIKAFRVKDKNSLDLLPEYDVDAYLLDTYVDNRAGGTGVSFDWGLALHAKAFGRPLILSGGLRPETVSQAIKKVKPYAVDISSGVEKSPGKKDYDLMKKFIEAIKEESYVT